MPISLETRVGRPRPGCYGQKRAAKPDSAMPDMTISKSRSWCGYRVPSPRPVSKAATGVVMGKTCGHSGKEEPPIGFGDGLIIAERTGRGG